MTGARGRDTMLPVEPQAWFGLAVILLCVVFWRPTHRDRSGGDASGSGGDDAGGDGGDGGGD